jgi:hypothetical protein
MIDRELRAIDPIPRALEHYRGELRDVMAACGVVMNDQASPGIERSPGGPSTARRAGRVLSWRIRTRKATGDTVVLFPAFGLADPVTWLGRRSSVWLVVHDPLPVARQFGTGRLAARLGRLGVDRKVRILVHSEPAADVLRQHGWAVELLPHPLRRPATGEPVADGEGAGPVTVLGQWKPARSLEPLRQFSAVTAWDGRRQVVGRGWPAVPGWSVDSRFVDEGELDDRIAAAACVLLPYERYFQSGIAVRCLESGAPVVGARHPFLEALFGETWPGLVDDDDWIAAAERVAAVPAATVLALRADYWRRCVAAWETSSLLSSLRG